jgi:hypothetical protein
LVNVVILHHVHAQTGALEDVGSGVQHTTLGIEVLQRQAGPAVGGSALASSSTGCASVSA